MLEFQRRIIPELSEQVSFLYRLRHDGTASDKQRHYHLPSGTFEVILDLRGRAEHVGCEGPHRPRAFLGGMFNNLFELRFDGPCDVVGAVLKPGAVHRFFDLPPQDLQRTLLPLDDLWPGRSIKAVKDLMEDHKVDPMEQLGRILRHTERPATYVPDPLMRAMAIQLRKKGGAERIGSLARANSLSTRHFRRRFKGAIGMPPKEFARLMRMNSFVHGWISGGSMNDMLARAEACGYYDLSHLEKDLERYLGRYKATVVRMIEVGRRELFLASSPLRT